MGKIPIVVFGIGAFCAFGLGCQSEGKLPFGDDALEPHDSTGQGGSAGSGKTPGVGGSGGGSGSGSIAGSGGMSGRGGSSGIGGSSGVGGSSGIGGSSGVGGSSGRGGSSSTSDPDMVGESCEDDLECESIPDGYCANAGICTRTCVSHVDCGCPEGTVNDDIADGACSAACITYDNGSAYCQRVCSPGGACEGNTYCEELEFYGVCTPR
jgi:hypothetical protein